MEHNDMMTRKEQLQEEAIDLISRMTDEQLDRLLKELFP